MTLSILSLFAGYGGLDEAVKQVLDAEVRTYAEVDPAASRVLKKHYPDAPNKGDVTEIIWEHMPPVDIITGGYPCQPFSHAGHRKGESDERHLWPHVLNAIRTLRPRIAFLENVAGHLSLGFDQVLADLAEIGWDAEWCVTRASDCGAPHHRQRLFLLAYPHGDGSQAERLPRRPAQEITFNHDLQQLLAGLGRTANIDHECRLLWGDTGPRVLAWALLTGHAPPAATNRHVTHHDPDIWGGRFPEIKTQTNPEFVEFMMGLPAGWVTHPALGLSRAQQLKTLGNGVVPQQAAAALTQLLERTGL